MAASHERTLRQYRLLNLGGMRSTSSVVVVGHGMVGHRFVEALRSRDADGDWRVTVLAEEADAAYDRVGLTGYTEHWDRSLLFQVVHVERGADPGDGQCDQVERAHPAGLPVVEGGDDEQPDELDHRNPDVAAAGVDAQRPALEPLRIERVDVGHRRREIAATEARQRRAHQIRPQRK